MLDCRIEGLEQKSPAVIIVDRLFKIKKNLKIFKNSNREIFIFTQTNNLLKEKYFKKNGVNVIKLQKSDTPKNEVYDVYFLLKQMGFNRILIESGIKYITEILKYNLIRNFYLFKTSFDIKNGRKNNKKPISIRKLKITNKNKVKINLDGDNLYKIEL